MRGDVLQSSSPNATVLSLANYRGRVNVVGINAETGKKGQNIAIRESVKLVETVYGDRVSLSVSVHIRSCVPILDMLLPRSDAIALKWTRP